LYFLTEGAFGAQGRARYQTYSQERYQTALKNIKAISVPNDFCGRISLLVVFSLCENLFEAFCNTGLALYSFSIHCLDM